MKKRAAGIQIFAAVIVGILSAGAGFCLSPLIFPQKIIQTIVVSENTSDRKEISDEAAGYEIMPVTVAEPLPENGQWKQNEAGLYTFENPDGSMALGWTEIDDAWYYFDGSGIMQTGWVEVDDAWYYLDTDGEMLTGWIKDNDIWYYMDDAGKMATNYDTPDGFWVDGSGALAVRP